MNNKLMGILGGMGMFATTNFISEILKKWSEKYNVQQESQYFKYIIYANPKLPSRSRHIFFNEESPLPKLKEDVIKLNDFGCDFIVMPCNTVHYYYDELSKISNVKILNMIEIVSEHLNNNNINNLNIIGTEGVYKSKIYEKFLNFKPSYYDDIDEIRLVINAVKENKINKEIIDLFKKLLSSKKFNLLCCTELSKLYIEYNEEFIDFKVIDPLDIFINYIINYIN